MKWMEWAKDRKGYMIYWTGLGTLAFVAYWVTYVLINRRYAWK